MLPTPNYVLMEDVKIHGSGDPQTLPAGTFIRPIDIRWVPKHIKDDNLWFNEKKQVYCYTSLGIIPISLDVIRRAS